MSRCRHVTHRCLLVEDEKIWIRRILDRFAELRRPDLFTVVFVGEDEDLEDLRTIYRGSAQFIASHRAASFLSNGDALVDYVAGLIDPSGDRGHTLVVVDNLLKEPDDGRFPLGTVVLLRAVQAAMGAPAAPAPAPRGLRALLMSNHPSVLPQVVQPLLQLARTLGQDVEYFEKATRMEALIDAMDTWRLEHGLRGAGPGPLLGRLLSGERSPSFLFHPVINGVTGSVECHWVEPVDPVSRLPLTLARADASALGDESVVALDVATVRSLSRRIQQASPADRALRYLLDVSAPAVADREFTAAWGGLQGARIGSSSGVTPILASLDEKALLILSQMRQRGSPVGVGAPAALDHLNAPMPATLVAVDCAAGAGPALAEVVGRLRPVGERGAALLLRNAAERPEEPLDGLWPGPVLLQGPVAGPPASLPASRA